MEQTKKVPVLRFPEFSGEWEVKKLNDVCNKIMDGTHFSPKSKEGARKYLTSKNIRNTGLDLSDCNYISEEEHQEIYKKCPVKFGDILLTKDGANTGNCCINTLQEEFSLLSSVAVLSGKEKILNSLYLLQLLQSQKGITTISNTMAGQAITRITLEKINKFKFPFPEFPEQTKIADFLTQIDNKINQLSQKKQLLERYKKGVMQQIFSQSIRFTDDDGREFPEWDFLELEKIAFKVNSKNKDCSIKNVLTNSAVQGIVNQTDYFDKDIANQNNLGGYYIVEIGDFVYNPRISSNALVGSLKRNNLIKGIMSPLYTVFRFKEGNLIFFEQYFQTIYWHDYMKSVANSGARFDRLNITNESFLNLPIPYPCIEEQTKIANFLTALDNKIALVESQLNGTKQYKKGLLQQLFV